MPRISKPPPNAIAKLLSLFFKNKLSVGPELNVYFRYPTWSPLANQIVSEYSESRGNIYLMELR